MPSEFSLFYVTFPSEAVAKKISATLLEEQLVACTNLFPEIQSQYLWQGKIESSKECVMILKSLSRLKEPLQARLKSLHPYETVCFLEIRLESGNPEYLQWLKGSL